MGCHPSTEFEYIIADTATSNQLREVHNVDHDHFISAGAYTPGSDYAKFYFEETKTKSQYRIRVVQDDRMLFADDGVINYVSTLSQNNDATNHFLITAEDGNCANGFVGTVSMPATGNVWQV